MDIRLCDFWWQRVAGVALHRRGPLYLGKYILNFKLTKYNRWKLSGWLEWEYGWLGLTVSPGQFGLLCRQVYMKVSKQGSKQVCK